MTWATRGACRDTDPELFFPISHHGPAGERDTERAKAICRACPVLPACRADVQANPPKFGVWAATTPEERRWLRAPTLTR
ncbi:WhiB family transcriptional regulator (plasmid) [Streptosporangium sandarakinum]|uniref:WhiB family transcriptional regulator n=1 Tax=Streptosporangium sandarakinum TaxID=1260955 RepID=UPI003D9425E2